MAKSVSTSSGLEQMLLTIGLEVKMAEACARYIEDGGAIPDHLPSIQFSYNYQGQGFGGIWSHIRKLHQKGKQSELLGRLLTVMLRIGQDSFLEASCGYVEDALWRRGCLTLMSSYEIPLNLIWRWFLNHKELSERMEKHKFAFIAHVAARDPELIYDQLAQSDKANQLVMTAHLLIAGNQDREMYYEFEQEFMFWIENEMMTDSHISTITAELMQAIRRDASTEEIKRLANSGEWVYHSSKEWLRLAVYLAEITHEAVPFSESLLRFLVIYDPEGFFMVYSFADSANWRARRLEVPNWYAKYGVPREVYIRLLASPDDKILLRAELARDRVGYEQAIVASSKLETLYLCLVLWEVTEGYPYLNLVEEQFLKVVEKTFVDEAVPSEDMPELMGFFHGSPLTEELKTKWLQYKANEQTFRALLSAAEHLWPHSILYNRVVCFLVYTDTKTLEFLCSSSLRNGLDFKVFLHAYRQAGGELFFLIPFLLKTAQIDLVHPDQHAWSQQTIQYLNGNMSQFAEHFAHYLTTYETTPGERCFILSMLMTYDADLYADLSVQYLADDSKLVRDKTVNLLKFSSKLITAIIPLLAHKKPAVRESVVRLVSGWDDEQTVGALQELYAREKSAKIKELIANALQDNLISSAPAVLSTPSASLTWLEPSSLPPLRIRESGEVVGAHMTLDILSAYAIQGEISRNWKVNEWASPLRADDLADMAYEVLNRWINGGAEVKEKWVLAFVAVFGDERVVLVLQACIQAWPLESRGAIACDAVRALLLSPLDSALVFMDHISRKFKFKQVKQAAADAFSQAAAIRGISTEELADRAVPNMGFDAQGCQTLSYGSRQFKIELLLNHDLRITDVNGKTYKTLPTPVMSDDSALAEAAQAKFKQMKKGLKTIRESIQIRLEQSFATRRRWTFEQWFKLFVANPIQHVFASGLIWGVYAEGELSTTFRYMEDGSFSSSDENQITLSELDSIRLVHPMELGNEERRQWEKQFEDYEVKQPIVQLKRNTFTTTSEEVTASNLMRYAGVTINGFSLLGAMTKFGWSKGSVVDGGSYYQYYKEYESQGVGASLTFSGVSIGFEDETVTIYELEFYRSGTVARGSYIYSEIKDEDRIRLGDIPQLLFSEFMYEVDTVLAKRIGKDEDWQLNRN